MLSLVALIASGCGGSGASKETPATTQPPTTSAASTEATTARTTTAAPPATTAAPPSNALGRPMNSQTFALKSNSGYTGSLTLTSYHVRRADSLPALPASGRQSLVACQV